ncbi:hypothetical protein [Geothermobacter ehrlichii]|uniref:hypothetical protein n=1 Tax=Geothermobacter ehrlichii TaxID=213224 RepID=UPI0011E6C6F8|nr:hypothetical protein [Geothermobacter ehrlichii]
MDGSEEKINFYTLRGLPNTIFGETYVVVSATSVNEEAFYVEYYILTQRPQESLLFDSIKIVISDITQDLGAADASSAIEEGLRQAEIAIYDLLEKRARDLNRPEIAIIPFELQSCQAPFVGCRYRGRFVEQIANIGTNTKCKSLFRHIEAIRQIVVQK